LTESTDGYSWPEIARFLDLAKEDKPASNQKPDANGRSWEELEALEAVINEESARLASVGSIIELCMEKSEDVGDALDGALGILEDANGKIASVEVDLRNLRTGGSNG
jgi:hypothetical protein